MLYLVVFGKTFTGLHGHIDRVFDDHFEAELYCTAQNDATKPLYKDPVTEYWIVTLELNDGSGASANRVYKPKKTKT